MTYPAGKGKMRVGMLEAFLIEVGEFKTYFISHQETYGGNDK
ncbi:MULTISPECIES: hypothetical protein [Flavobacterium]|nr:MULTISPECIES: hypothetical protein [Flavobacterium]